MTVFAELTDGRGKVPISLRIVDADEENPPLMEASAELDMADPLAIFALVLRIDGVVFPLPGEYRIQLSSGDEPLMERRLVLIQHGSHS